MADFSGYEEPSEGDFRVPCSICGRKFLPESLVKHKGPCEKAASKKRRVFDSSKQRTIPGELNLKQLKQSQKTEVPAKKSNWRAKHADFINSIRAAKGAQVAMATGAPLPPPPPPSINPDYIQCQYCNRRFNQSAAERHIAFCKEQQKRIGNKPAPNSTAKAKQNARLQYQVPRPKGRGATSTDNGIGSPGARSAANSRPGTLTSQKSNTRTGRVAGGGMSGVAGGGMSGGGRMNSGTSSDSDYVQSPTQNRNNSQIYQGHDDGDGYGRIPTPGSASGRALRTGRDAQAYEQARKDAKMKRPGPGNMTKYGMNHSNNAAQNAMSPPGSYGSEVSEKSYKFEWGPQRGYNNTASKTQPRNMHNNASDNNNSKYSGGTSGPRQGSAAARFCHECGTKYPVFSAKFCCECGIRRMGVD